MNLKNRLKSVAALIGLAALAGCGGGNSGTQTQTVNGVVADGYLTGAKVCLDTNANKVCDANEPTGTTIAGGAYTISNVSTADLAKYSIVVEVPVDAVDSERGPVTSAYVMTAPAGKPQFVSPLTTLVQNQIEKNGLPLEEAVATVKAQLGLTTLSPLSDYKPGTSTNSEDRVAAGIAKVIATTIAGNRAKIEQAVADSATPVTVQQVVDLILKQVMENLSTVVQQVNIRTGNGANSLSETDVSGVVTDSGVSVSVSDSGALQALLIAAGTKVESSSFADALIAGMYSIEQWQNGWDMVTQTQLYSYWFQKMLFTSATNTITFSEYNLNGAAWQSQTSNARLYLTSTGWKQETVTGSGTYNPATNAYNTPSGFEKMAVRAVQVDVSSQLISTYLKGSFESIPTVTATFPAGSLAYKMTMVPLEDIYRLDIENNNLCKLWDINNNSCASGYASLDELLATVTYGGNWISYNNGISYTFGPLDATTKKGQISIFSKRAYAKSAKAVYSDIGPASSYSAGYERKTVNGVDMLIVDLTSVDGQFAIFAVYNGQVYEGKFKPKNVARVSTSFDFNKTAIDAILTAANLPAAVGKAAAK